MCLVVFRRNDLKKTNDSCSRRNEYMKDVYELRINDEMNEMILAVRKQCNQLHFLA